MVFVDTSALKALYDERDDCHARAEDLMRKIAAWETPGYSTVTDAGTQRLEFSLVGIGATNKAVLRNLFAIH